MLRLRLRFWLPTTLATAAASASSETPQTGLADAQRGELIQQQEPQTAWEFRKGIMIRRLFKNRLLPEQAQRSVYSVRTAAHVSQRIALDMERDHRATDRCLTLSTLHLARADTG